MTPMSLITEDITEVFGPFESDQLSPTEDTSVTKLDANGHGVANTRRALLRATMTEQR